jgi:hypothetical protein
MTQPMNHCPEPQNRTSSRLSQRSEIGVKNYFWPKHNFSYQTVENDELNKAISLLFLKL